LVQVKQKINGIMQPFTRNRLMTLAGAFLMGMSFNLQAHENGGG
jgi:hypothetical protein